MDKSEVEQAIEAFDDLSNQLDNMSEAINFDHVPDGVLDGTSTFIDMIRSSLLDQLDFDDPNMPVEFKESAQKFADRVEAVSDRIKVLRMTRELEI